MFMSSTRVQTTLLDEFTILFPCVQGMPTPLHRAHS